MADLGLISAETYMSPVAPGEPPSQTFQLGCGRQKSGNFSVRITYINYAPSIYIYNCFYMQYI